MINELTVELLEKIKHHLPADCVLLNDPWQVGLRARVNRTDPISFYVVYEMGKVDAPAVREARKIVVMQHGDIDLTKPHIKLGELPALSLERARELASVARSLAGLGIDPKEALSRYL